MLWPNNEKEREREYAITYPQFCQGAMECLESQELYSLKPLAANNFSSICIPQKRTRSKLVHGLIWFAYLLADWIAPVAIGLISLSEGVGCEAKGNKDLMAFWASFLLLHLGGPDTITSFALEDNEFWLRHLVGLILQIVATAYIFYQSLPNKLWAPTIMVFFVGCIKYGERTRALFLASMNQFGCSVLPKPEPGPDYE